LLTPNRFKNSAYKTLHNYSTFLKHYKSLFYFIAYAFVCHSKIPTMCKFIFLHFFIVNSIVLKNLTPTLSNPCHALYQRNCRSLCNPTQNWHFFIKFSPSLDFPLSNTFSYQTPIPFPRNTYIRNGITLLPNRTLLILIRFQWIELNQSLPTFKDINLFAQTLKLNVQNQPCPILYDFLPPQKFQRYHPLHILRGESDPNPGVLLLHKIISRVNGTPTDIVIAKATLNSFESLRKTANAIGPPAGVTTERWLATDYSSAFTLNKLIFLTGLPKPSGYNSFSFLTKPLGLWVWVNICVSSLVLTLTLKAFLARHSNKLQVKEILYSLLQPLLDQSISSTKFWRIQSCSNTSRFLILSWIFSCMLMSTLYRSFITGYLIQPSLTFPPKTFQELALSQYKLVYSNWSKRTVVNAMVSSVNEYAKRNQSYRFVPIPAAQVCSKLRQPANCNTRNFFFKFCSVFRKSFPPSQLVLLTTQVSTYSAGISLLDKMDPSYF